MKLARPAPLARARSGWCSPPALAAVALGCALLLFSSATSTSSAAAGAAARMPGAPPGAAAAPQRQPLLAGAPPGGGLDQQQALQPAAALQPALQPVSQPDPSAPPAPQALSPAAAALAKGFVDPLGFVSPSEVVACADLPPLKEAYDVGDRSGLGSVAQSFPVTKKGAPNGPVFIARVPHANQARPKEAVVQKDLKIARLLKGGPHMMQLEDVVCEPAGPGKLPWPVMVWNRCDGGLLNDHLRGLRINRLPRHCANLTRRELQRYARQWVEAVRWFDAKGVMHRDFMAHNTLLSPATGDLCVIDFGSSFPIDAGNKLNTTAMEAWTLKDVTINVKHEDTLQLALSVAWLLSVPAPAAYNPGMQWGTHFVPLLGTDALRAYLAKYGLKLSDKAEAQVAASGAPAGKRPWAEYRNACNAHLLDAEAASFLDGLVQYAFEDRREFLRASALEHPFLTRELPPDEDDAEAAAADAKAAAAAAAAAAAR